MNFITLAFFIFLAVAALVYYILPRIARAAWLLCCSYVFYLYDPANAGYLVLLCAATLVTWGAGLVLERVQRPAARKAVLAVCVAVCIGSLGFYKYAGMVTQWLNGLWGLFGQKDAFTAPSFAVPLGISYFSFMALGYAIDVYRGKPAEHNVVHYALFVSFFPCIVTGPIERGEHILPQLASPAPFEYGRFCGGMFRILWGLFKKLVVADNIGVIVASVYGSVTQEAYTGPVFLLASVLFAYQLYCDFSACTDIAIGAGEMFGIRLMENFHRPLAAHSFTDLWRRWHISLTSWFRDYLYIPLGGNRRGKARQYINQLVVFLVSGLWHGASLSMVVWGLLNGVYLCVGKATQDARRKLTRHNPLYHFTPVRRIFQTAVTYLLFTSCIIFFRSSEVFEGSKGIADALYIYGHLFSGWGKLFTAPDAIGRALVSIGLSVQTALVLAVSILVVETLESVQEPVNRTIRKVPIFLRWPLYYALVLGMLFFGSFANSGSIYGRF